MSKPVKNLITKSYQKRFGELDSTVIIDVRSIKSNDSNKLRGRLATKKIKVTVVRNALAKKALVGTKLENVSKLLQGPSAMVYGGESVVAVARELIDVAKEIEALKFKGALLDGLVFGPDQIEELSKYPTKSEAQAQVVTIILSPARKIAGQIVAPGRKLASLIKAIQEKKEKEEGAAAPAAA